MRRSSLKRSAGVPLRLSRESGLVDRHRLLDSEDVECSDVPTMSRIFERGPGFRDRPQSKFIASIEQEANPLRSKGSNRVQQQLRLILRTIKAACRTLLVIHAETFLGKLSSPVCYSECKVSQDPLGEFLSPDMPMIDTSGEAPLM